ncbi:uncharacterized protein LOC114313846 isoform X2 [Camellia sinensis]|uniref:uncharacterized protein LOC114313846 isoform X2 n=1 Tax=Camellia sinensis TaxID=4442 RepID=UPI001035C060|nr:uncharacterized protein LOC114313846 isoform X2 [Camellia sinensis]
MQAWSQLGPVPTQLSRESAVDVERVVRVVEHLQKQESSTDDSTIQLYEQLSFSYPALQQPLFNERDTDNSVDFLHQNSLTTHQPVAASSSSTGLSVNP